MLDYGEMIIYNEPEKPDMCPVFGGKDEKDLSRGKNKGGFEPE